MGSTKWGPRGRAWAVVAVVVGLIVSGGSVWLASQAAFSGRTEVGSNSFSVGSVAITNDRSGSMVFTGGTTNMTPGATDSKCIRVAYHGTLAAQVKLYASAYSDTGLARYLHLTIEEGDGGAYADCAGFTRTAQLVNDQVIQDVFDPAGVPDHRTFAAGLGGAWTPGANPSYKTYRISYLLPQTTNDGQGSGLVVAFTWEAIST